MTIYFDENKEAYYTREQPPSGAVVVDDDIWHLYCTGKIGIDWDIIDHKFVKLRSEDEMKLRLNAESEILQLKRNLAQTDYKTIKFAEGEISEEEFAPIREQRKQWRERIRLLESYT